MLTARLQPATGERVHYRVVSNSNSGSGGGSSVAACQRCSHTHGVVCRFQVSEQLRAVIVAVLGTCCEEYTCMRLLQLDCGDAISRVLVTMTAGTNYLNDRRAAVISVMMLVDQPLFCFRQLCGGLKARSSCATSDNTR